VSEHSILRELLATLDPGLLPDTSAPVHQQTSIQHTMHLDISDELDSVLYPTNRLIYSPHTIEPRLLQPFLDGTKEVILVCVQNGKTLPATLQALHSSYLIADTQHSVFRRKRGETVLVVFPVTSQQHYVLQTAIHNVYAFRLELEYRDPRYDVRHYIPNTAPVTLQPVPTTLITAIGQQQGRIVRQITLTPRNVQGTVASWITDLFCAADTDEPIALPCEGGPALACALHDLSLSGVCLTVNATHVAEALDHHLVRLTIPLPRASQALPGWASVSLTLQLLGVVRNVSHTPSGRALHIRFLKRLLPEVDTLLWHLEGGFAEQPNPVP
jgi:hypothetical protein